MGLARNGTPPPPAGSGANRHHPYEGEGSPYGPVSAAFTPPQTQRRPPLSAASPYAHTPPYSPNVYSPQFRSGAAGGQGSQSGEWAASTPRYDSIYQYSPHTLGKLEMYGTGGAGMVPPSHHQLQFSPCKPGTDLAVAASASQMCSYDAASSALNNNSLLQTAMTQSPYKFVDHPTLHSL